MFKVHAIQQFIYCYLFFDFFTMLYLEIGDEHLENAVHDAIKIFIVLVLLLTDFLNRAGYD